MSTVKVRARLEATMLVMLGFVDRCGAPGSGEAAR
jgi:hypothetical protein